MISVLVYGRNDARGYGMHKRVAMSLNAIAEVLSAPTSEILFVDYNTPNHLPTLPELIRDMLTEKARLRTRVLRVRPHVHARFAAFTPLPVLEPVARNIALRRSRPQNKWILSTNTDAIFVLPPGKSLCDIAGGLQGTHYATPRFELPERLWESLDRLDPVGVMANVGAWGTRARLNEIVRGQGAVQFDNPGDFQLVRRSALFAIDGFDEEALLGWHVDHNLVHRLNMKFGAEGDLSSDVKLYHCSHARQATATHSHDRIENDVDRFVHHVGAPDIPRQRDVWGCIDDQIGEFDLRQPTTLALMDAIDRTVKPLAGESLEASYTSEAFDTLWYDAGHVGVHLLDLLSTFPRGVTLGLAGCRRDFAQMLASGLIALGFTEKLVIPEDTAERLGPACDDRFRVWPVEKFINDSEAFVFEFGLIRDESGEARGPGAPTLTQSEEDALDAVASRLAATARHEREMRAPTDAERMFVVINAVNSRFEPMVSSAIEATPSPFTTRLRYGPPLRPHEPPPLGIAAASAPSAPATPPPISLSATRAFMTALMMDSHMQPAVRLRLASEAPAIRKMLEEGMLPLPAGATADQIMARLDTVQAPAAECGAFPPSAVGDPPERPAPTAVANMWDFSNPDWLAFARRILPNTPGGRIRRDAWLWERAQLLWGLSATRGHKYRDRALLVAECADDILPPLADMFGKLDLIDVRQLVGRHPPSMLRAIDFATGPHMFRDKLRVVTAAEIAGEPYDAIIIPHSAAFRLGLGSLGPILSAVRVGLKPGGVLAIGGEIAMTGARRNDRPDWHAAGRDGFSGALAAHAGLNLLAARPLCVSRADSALIGTQSDLDGGLPVLGIRRDGDVFWPATWFFEATGASRSDGGLDRSLADLLLGEQLGAVTVSDRAVRKEECIIAPVGRGDGHVFYGPYFRLPEGGYQANVVVAPIESGDRQGSVKLVAEAAIGPEILIQQEVQLEVATWSRPVLFELNFSVPAESSVRGEGLPCEVRLWSDGKASFEVRSVILSSTGR
jgi:hypothetical protein